MRFSRTAVAANLVLFAALMGWFGRAEERKDAAERVQEGSVSNWMDYYKRERGFNEPRNEKPAAPEPRETPPTKTSEPGPAR